MDYLRHTFTFQPASCRRCQLFLYLRAARPECGDLCRAGILRHPHHDFERCFQWERFCSHLEFSRGRNLQRAQNQCPDLPRRQLARNHDWLSRREAPSGGSLSYTDAAVSVATSFYRLRSP